MKFRTLHDRVVVRRIEEDMKVVAAGPGGRDESGRIVPLDIKGSDCVPFGKWSGTEVKIDGKDLLIMKESDILGVIEGRHRCAPRPDRGPLRSAPRISSRCHFPSGAEARG